MRTHTQSPTQAIILFYIFIVVSHVARCGPPPRENADTNQTDTRRKNVGCACILTNSDHLVTFPLKCKFQNHEIMKNIYSYLIINENTIFV